MSKERQRQGGHYVWTNHFRNLRDRRPLPALKRQIADALTELLGYSRLEVLLLSTVVLCIMLRFIALSYQSLWADELFAVFWAKGGAAYVLSHSREETNPPLYYLILNLWMAMFGSSEFATRLLSAFASAITILIVYATGKTLFDRRAGLIAASFFGMSSSHLYFAQEVRAYALINLSFAVVLLATINIVSLLQQGAAPRRAVASLPGAGFVFGTAMAIYLHYVSITIILSVAIILALIWWLNFALDRKYFVCFAVLGLSSVVLSAPALAFALSLQRSPSVAWIHFPAPTEMLEMIMGAPTWSAPGEWMNKAIALLSTVLAFGWSIVFLYGAGQYRVQPAFCLVYVLPIVAFCVLVVASLVQPLLIQRTLLWTSIPVYVGLGGAAACLSDKKVKLLVAAIILGGCAFVAGYFAYSHKERWRVLVHSYVIDSSQIDLIILGSDTPATAFVYYHGERVLSKLRRWSDDKTSADKLDETVTGIHGITNAEIVMAVEYGVKMIFVSRTCATPPAITPANITVLRLCNRPPSTGWVRIFRFVRHFMGIQ